MAQFQLTVEDQNIISQNPIHSYIRETLTGIGGDIKEFIATAASNEDAFCRLNVFVMQLAATVPAFAIAMPGTGDTFNFGLSDFSRAWCARRTLSEPSKARLTELISLIMDGEPDPNIWVSVAQLLTADHPTTPQGGVGLPGRSDSHALPMSNELNKHWVRPYVTDSLEALQDTIRTYEQEGFSEYYARTLVFVQSSGTGKSRLADAYGEQCPMINYIISYDRDAFPPPDSNVLEMLHRPLEDEERNILLNSPSSKREGQPARFPQDRADAIWNHSIAVAFLQASFEIFNEWVEIQLSGADVDLKSLAGERHREMAPVVKQDEGLQPEVRRSAERHTFCEKVLDRGVKIARKLVRKREWRIVFNDVGDSAARQKISDDPEVIKGLFEAADKLTENLKRCPKETKHDPLLVFVVDEASNLFRSKENSETKAGLYVALNRVISCLKAYPIWFFFLSTESKVETLVPPKDEARLDRPFVDRSSARAVRYRPRAQPVTERELNRIPPFIALQLDIEDRQRMQKNRMEELAKNLGDFATPGHMAMFGRPLWSAYASHESEMYNLAKQKLIGGQEEYNPDNKDHVFAALSFRLSLDVCLQNPVSLPLSRAAVNSFLRLLVSMDQDCGVLDTITPSEPILARAAMEHLCDKDNWRQSIRTLTGDLLEKGAVEKGLKGELFARLMLVLAHDWIRCRRQLLLPDRKYAATYSVRDFLIALYGDAHEQEIDNIDERILKARMNFNHFSAAGQSIKPGQILQLCRDLLRRQGAIQLFSKQEKFDILIPCHMGEGPFNESDATFIAIQVKNRIKPTKPVKIFGESFQAPDTAGQSRPSRRAVRPGNHSNFILNAIAQPILLLLFDLGIENPASPPVEVLADSGRRVPRLWLIHSKGHTESIFGCLSKMGCEDVITSFFATTAAQLSVHDELAQRNWVFRNLSEHYRYRLAHAEEEGHEAFEDSDDNDEGGGEIKDDDEDVDRSTEGSTEAGPTGGKRAKTGGRGDRKRQKD